MTSPANPLPTDPPVASSQRRWESALDRLSDGVDAVAPEPDRSDRVVTYRLNLRDSRMRDQLVIDLFERTVRGDGELGLPRPLELDERALLAWPADADRKVLQLLLGNGAEGRHEARMDPNPRWARSVVRPGMYDLVLPALCETGRFFVDDGRGADRPPLALEPEVPGAMLAVERSSNPPGFRLWGRLVHEELVIPLEHVELVLSSGLALTGDRLVVLAPRSASWVARLRRTGPIHIGPDERDAFLVRLSQLEDLPEIDLPPELHWSRVVAKPTPVLSFEEDESDGGSGAPWGARLSFAYGDATVSDASRSTFVADPNGRRMFKRDLGRERASRAILDELGLKRDAEVPARWRVPRRELVRVVRALADEAWRVEWAGVPVRRAGALKSRVKSSIDWFELEAKVDFDGLEVPVPELLAPRPADALLPLPDGSRAVPPVWLDRYLALARSGRVEGGGLRFNPAQAGVLDALLSGHDDVEVDVKFDRLRRRKIDPARVETPPGFRGELRSYQREGVAWLQSLEALDCGGCLADDMGLGKTVQVLCWLQSKHRRSPVGPSLIVVPKSLVHNWVAEAAKFTDLTAMTYVGSGRDPTAMASFDLVVTTYGTLRSDILELLDHRFETVVLDEAQAIKNPRSQATKAAKLVRARQRLAISGTPIENGLAELWSIFDFVNPGMLGALDEFAAPGREQDEAWLDLLNRALEPLMLRRTKDKVLKDLPGKTEQTVALELGEEERRRYDELLSYYRASLEDRISREGLAASRFQVLEALLRLRQAACHPGLVDPSRVDEPSAKVDFLVDRVEELATKGHKCLVFSQFTGLLDVVERALRRRDLAPAYLDGQTRNRQAVVDAFRTDRDCPVFLISLKAGGCGLNLVESDYVFLLDPWWNPAVEAQAIDRAHRMGQKRHVFAYRLIAKDTVEQKIVALQDDKRKLADAILSADGARLKDLDAADLEALFAPASKPTAASPSSVARDG